MPLVIVLIGVLLLFLLISGLKLNAFIAFILVSFFVGVAEGLPAIDAINAIQTGIGNTLSSLVMILAFGAMLGKLVATSGAAQKITQKMVAWFGETKIQWALVITGFIVGIPMFYTVGFVIMVPLVFTVAATTRLPLLYVGLPMLASLSATHAYLPPHPAPTAIALMYDADFGKTLWYGFILAIPGIGLIVPFFSKWTKRFNSKPLKPFVQEEPMDSSDLPGILKSISIALMPVFLIGISSLVKLGTDEGSDVFAAFQLLGDPVIAMLISVLIAIIFLGLQEGRSMKEIGDQLTNSLSGITIVLLVISGAGGLKQVLIESGVSAYIGSLMAGSSLSPLLLAWLIAAIIRVCVGSATVAGMTAAGIVLPLVSQGDASPELMVLSIGAGSIFFSHVNDGGFWLFKEYFNLSVKDTLLSWSLMESTLSIFGLIGVLILNLFIG